MTRLRTSRLLPALALAALGPFASAQMEPAGAPATPGAPGAIGTDAPAPPAGGLSQADILSNAAEAVNDTGPAWTVSMDLRRAMQSPLADSLLAAARSAGQPADFAAFQEETGLDARTDIGGVVVSGMSLKGGDATLVADLGDSSGRLEAWFAEQDGHEVRELADGSKLHHFRMEPQAVAGPEAEGVEAETTEVWASLRDTDAGVRLVASTTEQGALDLVDDEDLEDRLAPAPGMADAARIFSFRVPEVPENSVPEGVMGGQAFNAVRGVSFSLDSGEELTLDLRLDTERAGEADQLQQVIQGFVGMVPMMAPSMGLPPEQVQGLSDVMRTLNVVSEPADANAMPGVRLKLGIPQARVDAFMKEAAQEDVTLPEEMPEVEVAEPAAR